MDTWNAKKVSSEECRKLLSDIKLGTDLGIIRELNDAKVSKLELYTKPGNLQKYLGKKLDAYERDIQRAKVIKQIINSWELLEVRMKLFSLRLRKLTDKCTDNLNLWHIHLRK